MAQAPLDVSVPIRIYQFVVGHQWVVIAFAIWGFIDASMKFSEILARELVAWSHRMRLYWRRFRSEPDPNVL